MLESLQVQFFGFKIDLAQGYTLCIKLSQKKIGNNFKSHWLLHYLEGHIKIFCYP